MTVDSRREVEIKDKSEHFFGSITRQHVLAGSGRIKPANGDSLFERIGNFLLLLIIAMSDTVHCGCIDRFVSAVSMKTHNWPEEELHLHASDALTNGILSSCLGAASWMSQCPQATDSGNWKKPCRRARPWPWQGNLRLPRCMRSTARSRPLAT